MYTYLIVNFITALPPFFLLPDEKIDGDYGCWEAVNIKL